MSSKTPDIESLMLSLSAGSKRRLTFSVTYFLPAMGTWTDVALAYDSYTGLDVSL